MIGTEYRDVIDKTICKGTDKHKDPCNLSGKIPNNCKYIRKAENEEYNICEFDYQLKMYKYSLFETLKSLISLTVETRTVYNFMDLEYGIKIDMATFEELRSIVKSEEWQIILKQESKRTK